MPTKIHQDKCTACVIPIFCVRISTPYCLRILQNTRSLRRSHLLSYGNIYCNTPGMKRFFSMTWAIVKKTVVNFYNDDSMSYASSIAFYTIFSMPAILIIALSIGTTFYERNVVQEELINQVERLIGMNSEKEITEIISNARLDSKSAFAKTVGIITALSE